MRDMDPGREDYDDGPPTAGQWCARERWVVLLPGVIVGIALAGAWCFANVPGPVRLRLEAWGLILAGPVPAFFFGSTSCCFPIALLAAPAMVAHPVRPNVWTGMLTTAALAVWLLAGWIVVMIAAFGA